MVCRGLVPLHLKKRKKMKKNYLEPETELIELETFGFLASSTGDTDDSSSDTELTGGNGGNANDPGFGGDY